MFKLARHHNWLIFSIINPNLELRLKKFANGKMVDIGCGEKPYKLIAAQYIDEHIGVDHKDTLHKNSEIDLEGTAYNIPVDDGVFDCALCTDVLEHLEEPDKAIAETNRVLKKGAYAVYTVPMFWHLHEQPRDFFRFTKYGLKYLFEKNGFECLEITPLSGFIVTFSQELVYYLNRFRIGGKINPLWWLIPILGHLIQGVAYLLNKIDHSYEFTVEFIVVAKKNKENE